MQLRRGYAEIYAASLHVIIAGTVIVWQRNGTREQSWTTKQANRQHEQEDNCQKLSLVFNRKGCNQRLQPGVANSTTASKLPVLSLNLMICAKYEPEIALGEALYQ